MYSTDSNFMGRLGFREDLLYGLLAAGGNLIPLPPASLERRHCVGGSRFVRGINCVAVNT